MKRDDMLTILDELAKPIDFADLIERGVLKRSGAWFIVMKPREIPSHAWRQVNTSAQTKRNGEVIMKLKFKDCSKAAVALRNKLLR
jgi:hypothetical protein